MIKQRVVQTAGPKDTAHKRIHKQTLSIAVLLLGILIGDAVNAQKMQGEPGLAVRVTALPMAALWIQPVQSATAEVVALNHAQVSAQANGEVLKLGAEVGDEVEKGDILVELDCRQSELSEAVLNDVLSLARKEYKRAQSLQKSKTIAEQEISRLQSVLEQARIRILQAELAVEHCLIKAPFNGVVTTRQVQLGMIAITGAPMMKLLQADVVEVAASVDAAALNSLKASNNIQFKSAGMTYPITIRTALPLIDPASNKQRIRLDFIDERPYSGAAGELEWPADGQYLPSDLLIERQGQLGYFIAEEGIARFMILPEAAIGHPAKLGSNSDTLAEVLVILDGRFKLSDGDSVVLVSPAQ